jgi:hypothetical protein
MVDSLIFLLVVLLCEAGICLPLSANKEMGIDADSIDSEKTWQSLVIFCSMIFKLLCGVTQVKKVSIHICSRNHFKFSPSQACNNYRRFVQIFSFFYQITAEA